MERTVRGCCGIEKTHKTQTKTEKGRESDQFLIIKAFLTSTLKVEL
jgi:hypothetical protein